jgi:hypothetical protein
VDGQDRQAYTHVRERSVQDLALRCCQRQRVVRQWVGSCLCGIVLLLVGSDETRTIRGPTCEVRPDRDLVPTPVYPLRRKARKALRISAGADGRPRSSTRKSTGFTSPHSTYHPRATHDTQPAPYRWAQIVKKMPVASRLLDACRYTERCRAQPNPTRSTHA